MIKKMLAVTLLFITNSYLCFAQVDSNKIFHAGKINDSTFVSKQTKTINAKNIIEKYLSAIGGRKNLKKIIDRTTKLTGIVQGAKVKMIIYQKSPDKYLQKISLGTTEQKTIFNGKEGYVIIGDKTVEISGDDLDKLKYEAAINLMLLLKVYNVKPKFIGEKKINNGSNYELELIFPSGMKWKQFYDQKTGLKIKEIKTIVAPEDTITQETNFSDYKNVNGIKYPFKIKQKLGLQHFEFTVDSIKINTGLSNRNFELEE